MANEAEADTVRHIFRRYLELGSAIALVAELDADGIRSKSRISRSGRTHGGQRIVRGALYAMVRNRLYIDEVEHKGCVYPRQHDATLDRYIFDAATCQLQKAGGERSLGSGSPDPSRLADMPWDEHGRRMSPSHGAKGSRRYRYHVSQINGTRGASERCWRVSASDVERHVMELLVVQLRSAQRQLIESGECSGDDIQRLQNRVETTIDALQTGGGKEQRGAMLASVRRVELRQDALTVTAAFDSVDPQFGGAEITSFVPVSCVRSEKALKLIFPPVGAPDGTQESSADQAGHTGMAAREVLAASRKDDPDDLAAEMGYGREHAPTC